MKLITNATAGKTYSTLNRRRPHLMKGFLLSIATGLAVWAVFISICVFFIFA